MEGAEHFRLTSLLTTLGIAALVDDLKSNPGQSLVLAGDQQSSAVHALAHAINHALGNAGTTVHYTKPLEVESVDQRESLAALVADMNAGKVESLFIFGGNPVYDAPVDLDFAAALDKVGYRVHLGLYDNETSELCHWHIPESHFLEAWSDTRAHDGLATIVQPLIRPLYKSKSAHDLLAVLTGQPGVPDLDIVRQYWEGQGLDAIAWRRALHDGFVEGTHPEAQSVELGTLQLPATTGSLPEEEDLEIHFRPDPMVWTVALPTTLGYRKLQSPSRSSLGQRRPRQPSHGRAPATRERIPRRVAL